MATEKVSKAAKAPAKAAANASAKTKAPAASKAPKAQESSGDTRGPILTMNGKEYVIADLSAAAKENLQSIAFADQEVRRLNMMLGMAKTARNAYRNALVANLPQDEK